MAWILAGVAQANGPSSAPVDLRSELTHVTVVAASPTASAAVADGGQLVVWGAHQLAYADTNGGVVAAPLVFEGSNVRSVVFGREHALVVLADGGLLAWGSNIVGQLGAPGLTVSSLPVAVSLLDTVVAAAAGAFHSVALTAAGDVYTWGRNNQGQLGRATTGANDPVPGVVADLPPIVRIASGADHVLALDELGQVWAWGANDQGQLGTGTTEGSRSPVLLATLPEISALAGGEAHSLAIDTSGVVHAWGANDGSQLGVTGPYALLPVVVPLGEDVRAVATAAGFAYSAVVDETGAVWVWGENGLGQLGLSRTASARLGEVPAPERVPNIPPVARIAAGFGHVLVVDTEGRVWGWGDNRFFQLGQAESVSVEPGLLGGE